MIYTIISVWILFGAVLILLRALFQMLDEIFSPIGLLLIKVLMIPFMPFIGAQKWKDSHPFWCWFIRISWSLLYLFIFWRMGVGYHWF